MGRSGAAGLGDVVEVVEPDADDLLRVRDERRIVEPVEIVPGTVGRRCGRGPLPIGEQLTDIRMPGLDRSLVIDAHARRPTPGPNRPQLHVVQSVPPPPPPVNPNKSDSRPAVVAQPICSAQTAMAGTNQLDPSEQIGFTTTGGRTADLFGTGRRSGSWRLVPRMDLGNFSGTGFPSSPLARRSRCGRCPAACCPPPATNTV